MIKYKNLTLFIVYFVFISIWIAFGYFSIGALTDTFSDVYSAISSSLWEKFINAVPFIDIYRYRPFFFIFLKGITLLSLLFGISPQNFVIIKLILIIFYFTTGFLVYKIIFELNGNFYYAFLGFILTILYPNNLNSFFWTAGILELLVVTLFLSAILFKIIFVKTNKLKYYVLSVICFILALFTKEIALIYPFVGLIILIISFPRQTINKNNWQFYIDFLLLLMFLIIRLTIVLLQTNNNSIKHIVDLLPSIKSIGVIFLKSCFSLFIPFDYYQTLEGFSSFNLYILFYVLIALAMMILTSYRLPQKALISSIIVFIITIIPLIIAGYTRPQLILLSFCLVIITLLAQNAKFPKLLLLVLIIFWIYEGIKIEWYWKFSHTKFQRTIELLSKIDTEEKTTIVAGIPSRISQNYVADNIMFPYNLKKYGEFVIRDTIIDIPRVVYLSEESFEKKIFITKKNKDSYLLSCPEKGLFFYIPDSDSEIKKDVFENNFLKITVIKRNDYLKPSQLLLELKRPDLKYFFMQPDCIINLREL